MKKIDALKWLCTLSLIGFLYCFVTDLGFFMLFLESSKNSQDFGSVINIIIENLDDNGFVFNEYIASQVKKLYAVIKTSAILSSGIFFCSVKVLIIYQIHSYISRL